MASTLGYWKLRGFAQPIRLMLEYVEEKYTEKGYDFAPAPNYTEYWYKEKFNLGLDFPNLPYYNDGKVNISQSHTILRYLGRKYGLDGTTEDEKIRIDLATEEIMDFRKELMDVCYNRMNEDLEKLKKKYLSDTLPIKLKQWDEFIGDRTWIAGNNISFIDFAFYHYLEIHQYMDESFLKNYPRLQAYIKRVEALPQIKQYIHSDRFTDWPIWGVTASLWGEAKKSA